MFFLSSHKGTIRITGTLINLIGFLQKVLNRKSDHLLDTRSKPENNKKGENTVTMNVLAILCILYFCLFSVTAGVSNLLNLNAYAYDTGCML